MQVGLVVARYNEELGWLNKLSFNPKVTIYNKGPQIVPPFAGALVLSLPNVGRESHSYLYHIVNNYEVLPDVTIFVQGRVDDVGINAFSDLQDYVAPAQHNGFAASDVELLFPRWSLDGGSLGAKLRRHPRYAAGFASGAILPAPCSFSDFIAQYFGAHPQVIAASFSGCFAASRASVQRRPKSFYEQLLAILSTHGEPEIGHYMERLWCLTFADNPMLWRAVQLIPRRLWQQVTRKGLVSKQKPTAQ